VRGVTPPALDSGLRAVSFSNTTGLAPPSASSAAAISPVGPAPTTITSKSMSRPFRLDLESGGRWTKGPFAEHTAILFGVE
jgi:hypothetical protein